MTDRLAGKIALITGGARGIGFTTAELFVREGARVMLVDREQAALAQAAASIRDGFPSAAVETAVADVAKRDEAATAVGRALDLFGGLNTLVNNAAIRDVSTVFDSELQNWKLLMSVNLFGAVNVYKAAAKALRQSGRSSVVNVSSIGAVLGRKSWGAYDATKAAMLALTRTLACEEAEYGIRVNAICAGGTVTPFTVGRALEREQTAADLRAEVRTDSLLQRWASPEEIAWPIVWLASDEASFITGATLMVDGGRK